MQGLRINSLLGVLRNVKEINPKVYTKSSIMLGLGEQQIEVVGTMDDLRSAGVDIFTMGQYLQPTPNSLEVSEYVSLDQFEVYKRVAESKGFVSVAFGPFVRSSYKAGEFFIGK